MCPDKPWFLSAVFFSRPVAKLQHFVGKPVQWQAENYFFGCELNILSCQCVVLVCIHSARGAMIESKC